MRTAPPRRCGRELRLESLEGRELKTVSLSYGQLNIMADQADHNVTNISMQNGQLHVDYNGHSYNFAANQVSTINYVGGTGGYDTLTNNTNLTLSATAMRGNNQFTGGSGWNIIYLVGGDSSYQSQGGYNYVFTYGGTNNQIVHDPYTACYKY